MVLTPKQKLVYRMYHREGMQQVEIARHLRQRPETVCRILARASARLSEFVELHPGCRDALDAIVN